MSTGKGVCFKQFLLGFVQVMFSLVSELFIVFLQVILCLNGALLFCYFFVVHLAERLALKFSHEAQDCRFTMKLLHATLNCGSFFFVLPTFPVILKQF